MKPLAYGVSGFRSFGEDPQWFDFGENLSVYIGQNNCGKSNIFRFLSTFSQQSAFDEVQDFHSAESKPRFWVRISVEDELGNNKPLREIAERHGMLVHDVGRPMNGGKADPVPDAWRSIRGQHANQLHCTIFGEQPRSGDAARIVGEINQRLAMKASQYFGERYEQPSMLLPEFRAVDNQVVHSEKRSRLDIVSGADVISRLHEMQHPRVGQEKLQQEFSALVEFVSEMLGHEVGLEVSHDKQELIVTISGVRRNLQSFGSGIHHLVIIAAAVLLGGSSLYFLEEPEISMHPRLQRRLMAFLEANADDKRILITTHSAALIDQANSAGIYHISYSERKSEIQSVLGAGHVRCIVDDLGYRASELLQANGIIWVEGPSDRIYINSWISLVDDSLVEGVHYSVLFYGGRLLSHLGGDENDDFINVLRISRNAYVVMDRDGDSDSSKLNATKSRVRVELGADSVWVTKGREIENYIPHPAILRVAKGPLAAEVGSNEKVPERLGVQDKIALARSITGCCGVDEWTTVMDWGAQINKLVSVIRSWN